MSKQVDERVVSLQFDNKRFESNVSQSMSTLDKLKQKLNLKGASKGLDDVNNAAKKVDMKGLASGIETVSAKFSAMDVIGVTALANITNSAVNTAKQLLSSLTIAPVTSGFSEYELMLNSIQTTMAGTGKTAKEVEKELKKLDEYADKTVYSTSDMLSNLPKFTNAGVELEKATSAMIGIANATALAGGDAAKASIAFYNLGQAIGTGYLTRMDYNSINNAGIATMEWKNQMVDAAIAAGTLSKAGDDLYVAGGKSMTLQQLFIDGLQEQWATTEVMMKVFGDYGDETTEIGKKSYAAAQDIKTFSMMMDSLKATAGTGWKDTWQIIFGDLDAAKKMWTGLTNFISGVITKMADVRNAILESAFGRSFKGLADQLKNILGPVEEAIETVSEALVDYDKLVDEIIAGKWGNAPTRWQDLAAAGYDWAHAQNLVNERLGCTVRHATNYTEVQKDLNKAQETSVDTQRKLTKEDAKRLEELIKLNDAELEAQGYTKEQIKALRELESIAKKLGLPLSEFIEKIDEIDGRWLVLEGFANIGRSLVSIFKAIGKAWNEIFNSDGRSTIQKLGNALFNVIAAFHRFSRSLLVNEENSAKLTRTFKGLFAILDIIFTVVGGPIKLVFKILSQILRAFNLNLLDVTAVIGDVIVKFRDWIKSVLDFTGVFKWLAPYIKIATNAVKNWFRETKPLEKAAGLFIRLGSAIKKAAIAFKNSKYFEIGKNIILGLVKGLKNGVVTVWNVIKNIATTIIEKTKEVLGIHSPSTVFAAIGGFIIAGLLVGLSQGSSEVGTKIKEIINNAVDFIKGLDFGAIFAGLLAAGVVVMGLRISNALVMIANPLDKFGDTLKDVGTSIKKFANAAAFKETTAGIKNIAVSIALLAASVWLLAQIKSADLWESIGAIATLSVILIGLSLAVSKLNSAGSLSLDKTGLKVENMRNQIIPIAISLLLVAMAVKKLGQMNREDLIEGGAAVTVLGGVIVGIMAATKLLGKNADRIGGTILKISFALLMMVWVAKSAAKMKTEEMIRGGIAIAAFSGIIVGLMAATKLMTGSWNVDKFGGTILKISLALLLMVFVAKRAAKMSIDDMHKGVAVITAFSGIIVGLMAATKLITGSKNIDKIGGAIFKISFALLMMVWVAKIAAKMKPEEIIKGALVVTAFGGIIVGLMAAVKLVKGLTNVDTIGDTILKIALAIGVMAVTCTLLGTLKKETLIKGSVLVTLFAGIIVGLMAATQLIGKNANRMTKVMTSIAIVIGTMALAVTVLSFIDPKRLAVATSAVVALMGMFALIIKVAGPAKDAWISIATMTAAVIAIGVILILVSKLEPKRALSSAGALSILLVAMSGCLLLLSIVGKQSKNALLGILALTAMAVPLFAFVGVLILMKKVTNATANTLALVNLVIALSLLLIPLTLVGALAMTGTPFLGILALTAMAVPLLVFVGILALMQKIKSATTNVNLITTLMGALTDMMVKLAIVGPLALVGVTAVTALLSVITVFGTLALGLGAIMDLIPALKKFLKTGINVFIDLAAGLGKMISAFVGGLVSGLPEIGKKLSEFMTNAKPFVDGMNSVNGSTLKGVGTMTAAILLLTAADFVNGIMSFLSGGSSFAELGTQLSQFMTNAMPFVDASASIQPEIMKGVKTLAEAILILTSANLLEQIVSWIGGEKSLAAFGSQLGQFGTDLAAFIRNLGTFGEAQLTAVDCAGKAVKTLADSAKQLPRDGGIWEALAGDKSLAAFGSQLPGLGTALRGFIINLGTFGDAQLKTVDCAGKAVKALADSAANIPRSDGMWQWLVGDKSLAGFADDFPAVASAITGFMTNIGTFDDAKLKTVDCAGQAVLSLAKAADAIPRTDGLWQWLVGEKSLASFGEELEDLGVSLCKFMAKVAGFSEDSLESVRVALNIVWTLSQSELSGIPISTSYISLAAYDLVNAIEAINSIGIDKVSSAREIVNGISGIVSQLLNTENFSGLQEFGVSLAKLGQETLSGFVNSISNDNSKNEIALAVNNLFIAAITRIRALLPTVTSEFSKGVTDTVAVLTSEETVGKFTNAGAHCVSGFVAGIDNNVYLASNAGSRLGRAALDAAKAALDENSPSKEMYKVGDFAGIGFINALYDSVAGAYVAGKELGNSALDSTRSAMSRIVDAINGDMDMQPSIRPVLDLTDVRSGVNSIGNMLSGARTISVNAAGIGAISANMANRQNGNDDLTSAINKLARTNGKSGDTYNFNGFSYSEGSDVANAIQTLVRAAKMEGRT